jgi:hypothetical protein
METHIGGDFAADTQALVALPISHSQPAAIPRFGKPLAY